MSTHSLHWTEQKIATRLKLIEPLQYRKRHPIAPFRYAKLNNAKETPPVEITVDDSGWPIIKADTYWGNWAENFCMRTTFQVPEGFDRDAPIALHLPLGVAGDIFCHPEALAYVDGVPYVSTDRYHHEIMLSAEMADGDEHLLALHGWTGLSGWPPDPNAKTKLFMRECAVVEIDEPTREFVMHVRVSLDVAKRLDKNHASRNHLLSALDAAFKTLDTRDPIDDGRLYATIPAALGTLKAGIEQAKHNHHLDLIAVGHAHIDIAYLWRVEQARRKSGRTFSNVLHLMDRFPDYHFTQSQPQLYKYLEEDYPHLFEGIKGKVKERRWELLGGMWVEPDCSLTGPESLVRQILLGRRYFADKFGDDAETPCLWLPDTFGFAWSLPQLMKQAGLKWFVTNKLNWNQYNPMPFQLFQWQGIDGTKVVAHLLTTPRPVQYLPFATTYKAELTADEVVGTWENFKQKGDHHELIVAYGYGDGGGGPTRELIETAHILKDMPGVPNVCPGTVREFFEGIEATCAPDLPVWNGELYLELHRGTLTSESRTKRNNRKSEFVLHDTEFLSAFAAIVGGFHYPHDKLTECWERVCLNQFHDILPGTAIEEVFHDAERDYLFVRDTLEDIREKAIGHLAALLPEETAAVAINPSPFSADRVGYLPGPDTPPLKNLATGETIAMQKVYGGTLIDLAALPCYGVQALGLVDDDGGQPATKPDGVTIHQDDDGIRIETPLLEVIIGAHGELTRVFDKQAGRDAIKPGETGNQLLVFEDRPMTWDAWDIDVFYEDRSERITDLQKIEVIEEGPLRASVLIERKYRSSTIRQRICVYAHTKRIDFATRVDWYETHTLLKAAFPVDILSPRATFDIQWGNVERNTHRNSSWDFARFESVAQKWADLSEGNFGVALLNNCKYGYDIRDDVMRITLVKSATMPNPHADQGEHLVTYSLMPHRGNWRNGVQAAAYDLNDPVIVRGLVGGEGDQAEMALARTDQPYAVIETIKQAEDGRGIIVRMYECERSRGKVTVHFGVRMASVNVVNILEHDAEPVPLTGDGAAVEVYLKPFEIISLRCIPA